MRANPKRPLVAFRVFDSYGSDEADRFYREWKADTTVTVRRFNRDVRADGSYLGCTAIVVRRKVS